MRSKPSLSILALPLLLGLMLLALQFPLKTSANSLRRGVFPQRMVVPSLPVLQVLETTNGYLAQREPEERPTAVLDFAPSVSTAKSGRRGTGDACIGPVCGLGLFFASVWLTFVACFVVIFVADQRYERVQRNRRRHEELYASGKRRGSDQDGEYRQRCTTTAQRSPTARQRRPL
ncbi:hypothetical protein BBJ28_00024153 [Nothophytophthora sp. Chile5]|nr:hypothetical protein BBJ28_00024153 [Nothophytophthora sp. Chile5]